MNNFFSIDCKVGCKSSSNLMKSIETYVNLEEEVQEFKIGWKVHWNGMKL